ncbi:MAG TPA: MmcQ/YjbR family DNA-binding protein [Acidimicrobiales bacterium]
MAVLRSHCLALPEVNERLSHGAPTFFIRDKRSFVTVWQEGHHDVDFAHLWCACDTELRAHLIEERPRQFFLPAYVAHRGWIAVRLDAQVDVPELMDLLDHAYRLVAPASLVKKLG